MMSLPNRTAESAAEVALSIPKRMDESEWQKKAKGGAQRGFITKTRTQLKLCFLACGRACEDSCV